MHDRKKGFSLIELMVVIGIVGVLATLAFGLGASSRRKGQDVKYMAEIKQIQSALELYYQDNGNYPIMIAYITPTYDVGWSTSFRQALAPYMAEFPASAPANGYLYSSTNSGYKYGLAAGLSASGPSSIAATDGGYYPSYFEVGRAPRECAAVSKDWWGNPGINCP